MPYMLHSHGLHGSLTRHCCLWLQEQQIGAEEYEALCKGTRNLTPPPITDELSRWVNETQWSALQPLTQIPVSHLDYL